MLKWIEKRSFPIIVMVIFLMGTSFSIAILNIPKELRGGVYLRLSELLVRINNVENKSEDLDYKIDTVFHNIEMYRNAYLNCLGEINLYDN